MTAARLLAFAAGDFAERTRRHGFLLTLGFTVWAAAIFLPPLEAGYTTINIHGHRGAYDSAWVGAQVALLLNLFLGLFGFYLVRSAVDRDRRTGVGELLAATPLSRTAYTASKALSNFGVLVAVVAVAAPCAAVLQWVRGEVRHIEPFDLMLPFALVTLPLMALVASFAVLFSVLPLLRGGIGNLVWFVLWSVGGVAGLEGRRPDTPYGDPVGIGTVLPGMIRGAREAFPHEGITGERIGMGIQIGGNQGRPLVPFDYPGIDWTAELIGWRLLWVAVAVGLAAAAAIPFDRFAGDRGAPRSARRRGSGAAGPEVGEVSAAPAARIARFDPARLAGAPPLLRFDPAALVRAELAVALAGMPRAWFLVAAGLAIGALAAPLEVVKTYVAPLLFVWPTLIWSGLGTREIRHGTAELLFSAPRPLSRQLPAAWLSGVAVGACLVAPYTLRLALAGDGWAAATTMAGIAFAPALAMACGAVTGSGLLFQVVYFFLWYAAALNHIPALDFTGAATRGPLVAAGYAAAASALLAAASAVRRAHLAR